MNRDQWSRAMHIANELETLEKLKRGASICRYGDGEYMLMFEQESLYHQEYDPRLAQKLLDTFTF